MPHGVLVTLQWDDLRGVRLLAVRRGRAALPSLPREQQKAQERQELWRGLEELQLRRLQGTQGAKEAPLPRPTPQVAASGGQS